MVGVNRLKAVAGEMVRQPQGHQRGHVTLTRARGTQRTLIRAQGCGVVAQLTIGVTWRKGRKKKSSRKED